MQLPNRNSNFFTRSETTGTYNAWKITGSENYCTGDGKSGNRSDIYLNIMYYLKHIFAQYVLLLVGLAWFLQRITYSL